MKTESAKSFRFFFLITTLLMTLGQAASAAAVSLKVETSKESGSSIETPISTERCDGLGALQFDLTYDPAIVEPESVEAGSALSNGLVEFEVKSPGLLRIALISSAAVNESGELLKVRFKPVAAEGGSTDVEITGEAAWDYENNLEMLVTTEAGFLSLTPDAPPTKVLPNSDLKVPLVIGGVLLLLVVILIIALAMRGRKPQTPAAAPSARDASSESEGAFCEKCGAQHNAGARFCPECGHAIDQAA